MHMGVMCAVHSYWKPIKWFERAQCLKFQHFCSLTANSRTNQLQKNQPIRAYAISFSSCFQSLFGTLAYFVLSMSVCVFCLFHCLVMCVVFGVEEKLAAFYQQNLSTLGALPLKKLSDLCYINAHSFWYFN